MKQKDELLALIRDSHRSPSFWIRNLERYIHRSYRLRSSSIEERCSANAVSLYETLELRDVVMIGLAEAFEDILVAR